MPKRKNPHEARFHTADNKRTSALGTRNRKPTRRRPHGLYADLRPLSPKELAAMNKRIAAGVYANSH